jgi:hypothetical protein
MTLAFQSPFVSCNDVIGGEILQVIFDTQPSSSTEDGRKTPYVLISRNFEFGDSSTVEWHDGRDYDGGAEIVTMTLGRDRMSMKLDRDLEIEVSFQLSASKFATLTFFLKRMIDKRVGDFA